jgi:2-polyprenyl-3-methyl-5-hydroxy-6-metoxy-1,4-benzoquinol methylase
MNAIGPRAGRLLAPRLRRLRKTAERSLWRSARRLAKRRAEQQQAPTNSLTDNWFETHFDQAAGEIVEFFGGDGINLAGLEVADVGTGDGIIDLGLALKAKPARLVGFDINVTDTAHLLDQARLHGVAESLPANLSFVQSEATTIPAPDASFDMVVTWSAFEHVLEPAAVLREIRRILRPDGVVMLQLWPFFFSDQGGHLWEWFPDEGFSHLRRPAKDITTAMRANPLEDPAWTEVRIRDFELLNRLTLNELQQGLIDASFAIRKVELISHPFHVPAGLDRRYPLADLAIAGVKLLATPSATPP